MAASKRLQQVKKQGRVKYIGFTGHKDPVIFWEMLAHDYQWDAVQMPVNVLDAHFKSFQKNILPILLERNIGPIAMKTMGSGAFCARRRSASTAGGSTSSRTIERVAATDEGRAMDGTWVRFDGASLLAARAGLRFACIW